MLVNVGLIRNSRRSGLLVQPGFLSGFVTYTRTGIATGVTPSGDSYEVAANFPRFNANNELIWEGSRTNLAPNPRFQGAVAGTPGTVPTSTGTFIAPTGITRQVVGVTTVNGAAEYQIRFFGTPSSTGEITVYPLPAATAAATGSNVVNAVQARIVAGSLTNITSVSLRVLEYLGATYVREGALIISLTSNRASYSLVRTMGLSVDSAILAYTIIGVAGQPMDITIGYALPEVEVAAFASSTILPPVGTPGISTRGADTGQFSVTPTGAFVFAMRPGQASPTSTNQVYVTVNDGTDGNRWEFVCPPAGNNLLLTRVVGGTGNNTPSVGTQVPGSMVIGVLTWDSTGNAAVKIQGGTYRSSSSGPTGIVSGRLGNRISGAAALFGTIAYSQLIPNRYLTEAEMDSEIAKLSGYT
jgi:hypothetical protein